MDGDSEQLTFVHVLLSVLGLVGGFVVVGGLIAGRRLDGWAAVFLVTTILTSLTGFGFPASTVLPSHIVGGVSLVVLPLVVYALYARNAVGPWRRVFTLGTVIGLYLNTFVLVVQLFLKVPAMLALAPTQSEPAFALTHVGLLVVFIGLGRGALRGDSRPAAV